MTTPDPLTSLIEAEYGKIEAAAEATPEPDTDVTPEEDADPAEDVTDEPTGDEDIDDEAPEDEVDGDEEDPEDDSEADPDDEEPGDEDDEDEDPDGDEDEEDDGDEDDLFELSDDQTVVLDDGTELTVAELRNGMLRQADYTRKTQELAAKRQEVQTVYDQMAAWYEDRASDPPKWIAEIATGSEDPTSTIAQAVASMGKPDVAFAGIVRALVEGGKLSDQLVERLGLQELAEEAKSSIAVQRVEQLEAREREREEQAAAQAQQAQYLQHYDAQWQSIVEAEGLEFQTPQQEAEAKVELMRFAVDSQIHDLEHAWSAMAYQRSRKAAPSEEEPAPKPAKKRAKETVARKRKASAINRQSTQSGRTPRPAPRDLDSAVDAAWQSVLGD